MRQTRRPVGRCHRPQASSRRNGCPAASRQQLCRKPAAQEGPGPFGDRCIDRRADRRLLRHGRLLRPPDALPRGLEEAVRLSLHKDAQPNPVQTTTNGIRRWNSIDLGRASAPDGSPSGYLVAPCTGILSAPQELDYDRILDGLQSQVGLVVEAVREQLGTLGISDAGIQRQRRSTEGNVDIVKPESVDRHLLGHIEVGCSAFGQGGEAAQRQVGQAGHADGPAVAKDQTDPRASGMGTSGHVFGNQNAHGSRQAPRSNDRLSPQPRSRIPTANLVSAAGPRQRTAFVRGGQGGPAPRLDYLTDLGDGSPKPRNRRAPLKR